MDAAHRHSGFVGGERNRNLTCNHNVILVGTGEPDFAGDSYYGLGILRSADGGTTWNLITQDAVGNQFKGMGVSKFAWSTSNTNLVIAGFSNGTAVRPGLGGGPQGVYYSTDAGATWHKATNGLGISGSTTDVVYNSTANLFFAGLRHQGVFSSSDGQTWTHLASTASGVPCGL